LGLRALAGEVQDNSSALHRTTSLFGTLVSGVFLYLIAIMNLVVLVGIVKVFRAMRQGDFDEAELEQQLNNRGFMNRLLKGATRTVRKPWHIYPVGLLFGLGFDTATEVGLLVLAAGAAAFALPWYAILVLPVLFAAGMCMFDTADGCFMNFAYGWAFAKPVRKIFYNITITALSVAVAVIIGTVELISILVAKLGIDAGPLAAIAGLDLNYVGFGIVGLFVVTWVAALLVWRIGKIEQKWSAHLSSGSGE
jgi:high-affinity nickel-transport protein